MKKIISDKEFTELIEENLNKKNNINSTNKGLDRNKSNNE